MPQARGGAGIKKQKQKQKNPVEPQSSDQGKSEPQVRYNLPDFMAELEGSLCPPRLTNRPAFVISAHCGLALIVLPAPCQLPEGF